MTNQDQDKEKGKEQLGREHEKRLNAVLAVPLGPQNEKDNTRIRRIHAESVYLDYLKNAVRDSKDIDDETKLEHLYSGLLGIQAHDEFRVSLLKDIHALAMPKFINSLTDSEKQLWNQITTQFQTLDTDEKKLAELSTLHALHAYMDGLTLASAAQKNGAVGFPTHTAGGQVVTPKMLFPHPGVLDAVVSNETRRLKTIGYAAAIDNITETVEADEQGVKRPTHRKADLVILCAEDSAASKQSPTDVHVDIVPENIIGSTAARGDSSGGAIYAGLMPSNALTISHDMAEAIKTSGRDDLQYLLHRGFWDPRKAYLGVIFDFANTRLGDYLYKGVEQWNSGSRDETQNLRIAENHMKDRYTALVSSLLSHK